MTEALGKKRREAIAKVLIHFVLILFAIVILVPFYWMIVCSLRDNGDFYSTTASLLPHNATIGNYIELFRNTLFNRWLLNSLVVSTLSVVVGVLICAAAGFGFGIYRFKYRNILFWIVISSVAIPEIVTIIPVFNIMINFGLIDTYSSLVLPIAVNMFGIFLMKQFIETSLPMELVEAARIDGITEYGIFFKMALPLLKPGLGMLAIYLWITSWSGYFWPLIMLKSEKMMTVPLGLATLYADPYNLKYGVLMAGNLISTIPIIILFLATQELFIAGLTTGAVKG